MLAALANNGGPTQTHAPIIGSPAIDMGNPSIVGLPDFDQRGAPYFRVFNGDGVGDARIDRHRHGQRAGSMLSGFGELTVGRAASGNMVITDGAVVDSGSAYIGRNNGSTGVVTTKSSHRRSSTYTKMMLGCRAGWPHMRP